MVDLLLMGASLLSDSFWKLRCHIVSVGSSVGSGWALSRRPLDTIEDYRHAPIDFGLYMDS